MSVSFETVKFKNTSGLAISLTIEAPIGTLVYGPNPVGPNGSITADIMRDDCPSVLITAGDSDHVAEQSFALTPHVGRDSFLISADVQYSPGDIIGSVMARTG
jgi:hypothetical protein